MPEPTDEPCDSPDLGLGLAQINRALHGQKGPLFEGGRLASTMKGVCIVLPMKKEKERWSQQRRIAYLPGSAQEKMEKRTGKNNHYSDIGSSITNVVRDGGGGYVLHDDTGWRTFEYKSELWPVTCFFPFAPELLTSVDLL